MKQLIADLKAQLAAGTPGPWELDIGAPEGFLNDNIAVQQADEFIWPAEFCHSLEDAQLIITLRNNAEALLDYIEKLHNQVALMSAVVEAAQDYFDDEKYDTEYRHAAFPFGIKEALAALKGTK